jgi:hypothetical protein
MEIDQSVHERFTDDVCDHLCELEVVHLFGSHEVELGTNSRRKASAVP